jgi:Alg9-like mannosyltransferase family
VCFTPHIRDHMDFSWGSPHFLFTFSICFCYIHFQSGRSYWVCSSLHFSFHFSYFSIILSSLISLLSITLYSLLLSTLYYSLLSITLYSRIPSTLEYPLLSNTLYSRLPSTLDYPLLSITLYSLPSTLYPLLSITLFPSTLSLYSLFPYAMILSITHLQMISSNRIIVLGASTLLDRYFYGCWVIVPFQFLLVNVMSGVGNFYGTHSLHWYFTQGYVWRREDEMRGRMKYKIY